MPFCFQHTRTNVRHATISNSNPNNLSCKFKWDKNRRNVFRSLSHLLLCFCTGLCVRGNTKLRKDARKRYYFFLNERSKNTPELQSAAVRLRPLTRRHAENANAAERQRCGLKAPLFCSIIWSSSWGAHGCGGRWPWITLRSCGESRPGRRRRRLGSTCVADSPSSAPPCRSDRQRCPSSLGSLVSSPSLMAWGFGRFEWLDSSETRS